jgi:hypothetical protein
MFWFTNLWMICLLLPASILLFSSSHCPAQEYTFNLDKIQKKPFHLGGYAEINPILFRLNRDAALYKLNFYDRHEGSTIEKYDMTLQLDGSYEKGIARAFLRTNINLNHTYEGWSGQTTLYEGFLSLKPSPSLTMDMGKKTLKWGKGYAWNPVAFIDRPRNPDDPALALEGFFVATLDYIRSFNGPLRTFSFTPAIVPVYGDMNKDFGEAGHMNVAAKFYFLFLDTDIDVMFLLGGSKPSRYGFDFSRNITSNFEIHGEAAWIRDFRKSFIDRDGTLFENRSNAWNCLLGIRYLTAGETTYIFEFYHNETGFTESEITDYFSFIDKGYNTYISTGNDDLLRKASSLTKGRYGGINPMKNYLYLRVSQKEPFDILYFIPSFTWIFNVDDQSFSLSPELLYTGITNLELRVKAAFLAGNKFSEYREKQNDYRLELRARYFF